MYLHESLQIIIDSSILFNNFVNTYYFTIFYQFISFYTVSLTFHHSHAFFQFTIFHVFTYYCCKNFMTLQIVYFLCYFIQSMQLKKFSCASSFHFLLFLIVFLKIPRAKVNAKLKPGLAIPTDAPKAVANEAIEVPLIVADKIKSLIKVIRLLLFYSLLFLFYF